MNGLPYYTGYECPEESSSSSTSSSSSSSSSPNVEPLAPTTSPCGQWLPAEWPCGTLVQNYYIDNGIQSQFDGIEVYVSSISFPGIGTGTFTMTGTQVMGAGTLFSSELAPGAYICDGTNYAVVTSIESDTELHATSSVNVNGTGGFSYASAGNIEVIDYRLTAPVEVTAVTAEVPPDPEYTVPCQWDGPITSGVTQTRVSYIGGAAGSWTTDPHPTASIILNVYAGVGYWNAGIKGFEYGFRLTGLNPMGLMAGSDIPYTPYHVGTIVSTSPTPGEFSSSSSSSSFTHSSTSSSSYTHSSSSSPSSDSATVVGYDVTTPYSTLYGVPAAGKYCPAGTYNGKPYYIHSSNCVLFFEVYWNDGLDYWWFGQHLGDIESMCIAYIQSSADIPPTGDWLPGSSTASLATVRCDADPSSSSSSSQSQKLTRTVASTGCPQIVGDYVEQNTDISGTGRSDYYFSGGYWLIFYNQYGGEYWILTDTYDMWATPYVYIQSSEMTPPLGDWMNYYCDANIT
jgi:hypothetical protein